MTTYVPDYPLIYERLKGIEYLNFIGDVYGVPKEERLERSVDRKLKETVIALELTKRYSKDQILEWYMNSISYGGTGDLPTVAEGGEYTELAIGDSPETASFTKYGGYIPLTLELIDRDETRKLRAYPRELANAGLRRLSGLVAAIFTQNAG